MIKTKCNIYTSEIGTVYELPTHEYIYIKENGDCVFVSDSFVKSGNFRLEKRNKQVTFDKNYQII